MAKNGKQYTKIAGTWQQIKPSYTDLVDVPTDFNPSTHDHTLSEITDAGTVAAIDTNASTTQFLRGDGTWATPADSNTTYTAGTGLSLTGTVFANTAPDQTVALTGSGATTVTGTYPNFTISSTDNNTTYDLSPYALKASPALTGVPTAPTASSSVNNTQIATTAFVTNKLAGIGGGLNFEGTIDLSPIGGKNGDALAAAGLTAPGDYLIVNGTGVINNDGSPLVTLAVQAPGDEGDSTIPVTLETGDWIVYVSGVGTTMTVSIINNTDTRFAPTVHTHSIANVTGLQTALDGKAASSHTHSIANVTGLQTAIDGKLSLSGGTMTGVITTPNGTHGIIIGDDSRLADRNVGNTLFLEGVQNTDRGYINFSQTTGNALGAINGGDLTWRGTAVSLAGHTHSIANVTGLQTALDGKLGTSAKAADSNLLDGIDSASFLRSDADDTMTGDLLLSNAALTYEGQGGVAVPVPQGGLYVTQTSAVTGYLKITLPVSWTNTMLSFFVDFYEYENDETFTMQLAGYNYGAGYWVNTTANLVSSSTGRIFNVRFGHDGSNCAIYVGESNSVWSYPQVRVRDFLAGYSGISVANWADGWGVGFTTTLGTISDTQSLESVVSYADSAGSATNAGNADTVDGFHASQTAGSANTAVVRNASGYIMNTWFNSNRGDETSAAASYIYDTGDGYMRKKTLANARSEIVTSSAVTGALGYTPYNSTNPSGYTTYSANQAVNTDSGPTFAEVYNNGWFRNNQSGEGIYNQTTGMHWYSNGGGNWTIRGGEGAMAIQFLTENANSRGYVYADNGNNIGFLTNAGAWRWRIDNSGVLQEGTVPWARLSGVPTIPTNNNQLTNGAGYITGSGRAYPRRWDGGDINFIWSGQSGQPPWLWGGSDGSNMYVYNPSNFSVNYANSAGNADTVDGYHAVAFVRNVYSEFLDSSFPAAPLTTSFTSWSKPVGMPAVTLEANSRYYIFAAGSYYTAITTTGIGISPTFSTVSGQIRGGQIYINTSTSTTAGTSEFTANWRTMSTSGGQTGNFALGTAGPTALPGNEFGFYGIVETSGNSTVLSMHIRSEVNGSEVRVNRIAITAMKLPI